MEIKTLEQVLEEAEASWQKDNTNENDKQFKNSFILGWLKSSYQTLYDQVLNTQKTSRRAK